MFAPTTGPPALLWRHPDPESTALWRFLKHVEAKYGTRLYSYAELHRWSIEHVPDFWSEVWNFVGVRATAMYERVSLPRPPGSATCPRRDLSHEQVVDTALPMHPRPPFFAGARLNFAENLLFPVTDSRCPFPPPTLDAPALLAATETSRTCVSWAELRARVQACQTSLRALGVAPGERVAGLVANRPPAVVAMLAATSLGAVWTALSPDTGPWAALERLRQITPAVLFADTSWVYNGRVHKANEKIKEVAASLAGLRAVVLVPSDEEEDDEAMEPESDDETAGCIRVPSGEAYSYSAFVALGAPHCSEPLRFTPLPADHPLYILYSSGTTGPPKCIVHGAAGTLLQHKKEHVLHCQLTPRSRLFYYTTTTWMMWHWLVSGLACGATIVLYDGSPFRSRALPAVAEAEPGSAPAPLSRGESVHRDAAMLALVDELKITHFGTSAKYLSVLEQKGVCVTVPSSPLSASSSSSSSAPPPQPSLASLEAVYSTGAPLAPSTFHYVYTTLPAHVMLASITGGTDIVSLFGTPNPLLPVHAGEVQCAGLGMAIRAFDERGADVTETGAPGDLVCTTPFPSMPIAFWGPHGTAAYRATYFERYCDARSARPIWHHGDFVRFNSATGGLVMLGRSDGTLKPAGVRFGSAEIYNVLLARCANDIADALCVGRRREGESDETVVLFLKMAEGVRADDRFVHRVKTAIRDCLSVRHVPAIVAECPSVPVTANGKK